MKPSAADGTFAGSFSRTPLLIGLVAAGLLLAVNPAPAQTTNMAQLRELRVACLESLYSSKTRLDELHGFVGQQAARERAAADQLFHLQQDAASAQRRNGELQQQVRQCTNLLSRAQRAMEQARTSYRAAVDAMPSGDAWAADGSTALNELRRAAAAAPRDTWKHKRLKEIEAEFVETLREWRAARRSMEQASFDLELRGAPNAFARVAGHVESISAELKTVGSQLAERQGALQRLSKQSEQWAAAIRALCEAETQAREHWAAIRFEFHLVDLKFAAWRLKYADVREEGIEALPDALEQSLAGEPIMPRAVTPIAGGLGASSPAESPPPNAYDALKPEKEAVEEGDATFRDLLARVDLARGRLHFVAEILQEEFASVQSAIQGLERVEEQARGLADDTARLAADQESMRRSLETEQQDLARGAETLDLVKKRFASDLKVINELLHSAAERSATLTKSLEH